MNDIRFSVTARTKVLSTFIVYKNSAPDTGGIDALLGMQEDFNETTRISLEAKVDGKIVYSNKDNFLDTMTNIYDEAELAVERVINENF